MRKLVVLILLITITSCASTPSNICNGAPAKQAVDSSVSAANLKQGLVIGALGALPGAAMGYAASPNEYSRPYNIALFGGVTFAITAAIATYLDYKEDEEKRRNDVFGNSRKEDIKLYMKEKYKSQDYFQGLSEGE